jgi:hypothetical protein
LIGFTKLIDKYCYRDWYMARSHDYDIGKSEKWQSMSFPINPASADMVLSTMHFVGYKYLSHF